jgi:hypothetical protein
MLICKTFPQVYNYFDRKTGIPYFQVSARSAKWGMHERKGTGRGPYSAEPHRWYLL